MLNEVTDDDIFFGSERCYYRHVPGSTEEFTDYSNYQFASESTQIKEQAANLSQKHKFEDQTYAIVVPRIPAVDITTATANLSARSTTAISATSSTDKEVEYSREFPDILKRPLIKCPPDHPDCLHSLYGVVSGVRSGLLKHEGAWYRLKGCGNNEEGFVLRVHEIPSSASSEDKDAWQEIRGCAFYNTSLRELYYTSALSACPSLRARDIISANESIGLSHYTHPSQALLGNRPLVRPVCILEATRGDRRLGSHVMAGIELILPLLIDTEALDAVKLRAAFPPHRPREAVCPAASATATDASAVPPLLEVVSTDRFICDYCLGTSMAGTGDNPCCQGLCWPEVSRDSTSMANMLLPGHALPERAPVSSALGTTSAACTHTLLDPCPDPGSSPCPCHCPCPRTCSYPQQWTNAGPVEMSARWRAAWDQESGALASHLERLHAKQCGAQGQREGGSLGVDGATSTSTLLAYLYACVGYDAGNFLRGA
jgi:hypothetical protein